MIAKKLLVCGKFLLHIQEFKQAMPCLEKISISQGLVALLHIWGVIPTPRSPETPHRAPISPRYRHADHQCRCIELRVF